MLKTSNSTTVDTEEANSQPPRSLLYWAQTLALCTASSTKAIVIPQTACGVLSALAGPLLTSQADPTFFQHRILARLPLVLIWNWLNLLLFDLSNQRLPQAVMEDRINKPWRPIPAGRMTSDEATQLLALMIPFVMLFAFTVGGLHEAIALMPLAWMYNDLGGCAQPVLKSLICAAGLALYSSGATLVASGPTTTLSLDGLKWFSIIAAIVLTTIDISDLEDTKGDMACGRRTLPIVLGDGVVRWSLTLLVPAWSLFCPLYWGTGISGFTLPCLLGAVIAFRILRKRSVESDRRSYKLWCVWLMILYALPCMKRMGF